MSARKRTRSDWYSPSLDVCFETKALRVLLRNGKAQTRMMVTPVFRLPDGTEFTGRRVSPELRRKLEQEP